MRLSQFLLLVTLTCIACDNIVASSKGLIQVKTLDVNSQRELTDGTRRKLRESAVEDDIAAGEERGLSGLNGADTAGIFGIKGAGARFWENVKASPAYEKVMAFFKKILAYFKQQKKPSTNQENTGGSSKIVSEKSDKTPSTSTLPEKSDKTPSTSTSPVNSPPNANTQKASDETMGTKTGDNSPDHVTTEPNSPNANTQKPSDETMGTKTGDNSPDHVTTEPNSPIIETDLKNGAEDKHEKSQSSTNAQSMNRVVEGANGQPQNIFSKFQKKAKKYLQSIRNKITPKQTNNAVNGQTLDTTDVTHSMASTTHTENPKNEVIVDVPEKPTRTTITGGVKNTLKSTAKKTKALGTAIQNDIRLASEYTKRAWKSLLPKGNKEDGGLHPSNPVETPVNPSEKPIRTTITGGVKNTLKSTAKKTKALGTAIQNDIRLASEYTKRAWKSLLPKGNKEDGGLHPSNPAETPVNPSEKPIRTTITGGVKNTLKSTAKKTKALGTAIQNDIRLASEYTKRAWKSLLPKGNKEDGGLHPSNPVETPVNPSEKPQTVQSSTHPTSSQPKNAVVDEENNVNL